MHAPALQVPDPQRLVPPIGRSASTSSHASAASEPGWACPTCRHTNPASKAECSRCHTRPGDRAAGPAKVGAPGPAASVPVHGRSSWAAAACCSDLSAWLTALIGFPPSRISRRTCWHARTRRLCARCASGTTPPSAARWRMRACRGTRWGPRLQAAWNRSALGLGRAKQRTAVHLPLPLATLLRDDAACRLLLPRRPLLSRAALAAPQSQSGWRCGAAGTSGSQRQPICCRLQPAASGWRCMSTATMLCRCAACTCCIRLRSAVQPGLMCQREKETGSGSTCFLYAMCSCTPAAALLLAATLLQPLPIASRPPSLPTCSIR